MHTTAHHHTHHVDPSSPRVSRATAAAFAAAGVLFVAYPALRPFSDEKTLDGAAAFASTSWLVAHSLAMVAFVLVALGFFGVVRRLHSSPTGRLAGRAAVVTAVGVGLTLPFYGAEAFGLHALGQEAIDRNDPTLVSMSDSIRFGFGIVFITVGLLALAVGAIMMARAIWRSGVLDRASGVTFAVAFALYLPQFSAPQPVRVAHGLVVLAGCVAIARALHRADTTASPATASPAHSFERDDAAFMVGAAH